MKLRVLAVLSASVCGLTAMAAEMAELKDQKAKVSYSLGMNIGAFYKKQEVELDYEALMQGVRDANQGKTTLLTEQQAAEVQRVFRTEHAARQEAKRKELAVKNKAEGEKFLEDNKAKPGVKTTASGLQYKVLSEGDGAMPKANDTVSVNYRGTLIDGTEFDSSYKRGQPASFNVSGVIKGWTEALLMMKPGAKWQLFIPSSLAYGETGSRGSIPPNATLIFDVELVKVMPAPPVPDAAPVTSDIIKVPSAEELKKGAKIEVIKADQLPKEAAPKK